MARGGGMNDLVYYGAILGGGWIGLNMAASGSFGPSFQQFAQQFKGALRGSIPSVGVGAGGVRVGLPSGATSGAVPAPGGRPCPPFVGGQQYVDARPDGRFGCVVGGQVRGVFGSQAEAEACYRQAFGCG
jgi:hypothetical protein